MSIKEQLSKIIEDPLLLIAVLQVTEAKLSPQQKYIRSEKGKIAKQKSNKKFAGRLKTIDEHTVRKYLSYWTEKAVEGIDTQSVYHESLSELWHAYQQFAEFVDTIKMHDFKLQLELFDFPIVHSYISTYTETRINRKVYELDVKKVAEKLKLA